MSQYKEFNDKNVLVTGGANGIGKATVEAFLNLGAKCIVADINEADLKTSKEYFENKGFSIGTIPLDVSNLSAVQHAFEILIAEYQKIDIVINNAGILRDRSLLKMSESEWDAVLNVNLKGVFNVGQTAAKYMVAEGHGVILNASSVVGLYGNYGQSNYVATKSGVIGMTKVWARELGSKGIRVNAIAPGFIETEILKDMPKEILEKLANKAPLKRLGQPEDIAHAYTFLASDKASFITGTCLSVDGGVVT